MIEWAAQNGLEWLINDGTIVGIFSEHTLQMGLWSMVLLAVGAAIGYGFRGVVDGKPRPKSARQLRREKRAQTRERRVMVARIENMPHLRQAIILTALKNGEFVSDSSTMPQAMTLHSEGYLNVAGVNGTGNTVFTPPTWMVDIIESDKTARAAIERAVEVYNREGDE